MSNGRFYSGAMFTTGILAILLVLKALLIPQVEHDWAELLFLSIMGCLAVLVGGRGLYRHKNDADRR